MSSPSASLLFAIALSPSGLPESYRPAASPPKIPFTYPSLPNPYPPLPKPRPHYFPARCPFPLPLRRRPNSLAESCTDRPSAKRIFRLVSSRQSLPASMRSMVDSETPALRASSAFAISCCSRNRCTLFTRPDLPIASPLHGSTRARVGVKELARTEGAVTGHFPVTSPALQRKPSKMRVGSGNQIQT